MAFFRAKLRHLGVLAALSMFAPAACYDTGDGSAPPINKFYFPVGLKVSHGGNVLYAVNSNFDLQYNGGTLQSYDLRLVREHALIAIQNPTSDRIPLIRKNSPAGCPETPPIYKQGEATRQPLGETCAPPVDSTFYYRDSAIIGAFATDLLLSLPPERLTDQIVKVNADDPPPAAADQDPSRPTDRLFVPVRGNATLTWATVFRDKVDAPPNPGDNKNTYLPFRIDCTQDGNGRCDALHQVGEDPNEPGNTRRLTLPGEPFAAAISEDGRSLLMTHQNETKTTLFTTGLSRNGNNGAPPAIEFIVDKVPFGGVGITPVPHDLDAFLGLSLPRPAFLETSRAVPEISLLRQYSDQSGGTSVDSTIGRPFLDVEGAFPVTASAGGSDSRGLVVDPTPRLACKAKVLAEQRVPGDQASFNAKMQACARKPARAFITNRSPAALLIGDLGVTQGIDGAYDPDRLTIHTSVPLSAGPSKVYLAPIVDRDGRLALRAFVVCFDSATVFVYDPDGGVLENVIRVGVGPFAMAFDPFSFEDVATHKEVPILPRDLGLGLRTYRFAYLASFTQSFVQVIDLDNAIPASSTYERIVYTLGLPTNPKGT